jgi:glycyl-tRNA synthetase beta chain
MAELLLELFSEEIPARMQARAAEDLKRLVTDGLKAAGLSFARADAFVTPRRLALVVDGLPIQSSDERKEEKGPKVGSPPQAIDGFLKKHGLASLDQCEKRDTGKGEFYFAVIEKKGQETSNKLPHAIFYALMQLNWPKSMRWAGHDFIWVRPLRSILTIFNGVSVPLTFNMDIEALIDESSDVPNTKISLESLLIAKNTSFGHRFLSPGEITVSSFSDYQQKLRDAFVILDAKERRAEIWRQAEAEAAKAGLTVRPDDGLLDEVTGLVEWPVVLIGNIDPAFMNLPAEVLTTSMRVNQKYFALLDKAGKLAPNFLVTANIAATDGGKAIIAGNERVLRARLADAQFFWDQDRKVKLADRVPSLDAITYHAKLGSVGQKMARVRILANEIGRLVYRDSIPGLSKTVITESDLNSIRRAAYLIKADLVSGMVGEFPELQGIMGRYYARHDGEDEKVADSIADHYKPLGPKDACPSAPVSIAVALADKIDTLVGFFAIGEKPTGSKDPFALRRAALGIIRLILENKLRLKLRDVLGFAYSGYYDSIGGFEKNAPKSVIAELMEFFADRLKVALKEQGVRHDLVSAVFALGGEDDFVRLLARVEALKDFVESADGANLLVAVKRAGNIVRIEEKKDGAKYDGAVDAAALTQGEEKTLFHAIAKARGASVKALENEAYGAVMAAMAELRAPVDAFFDKVTVNVPDKNVRANRLRLLSAIDATMMSVADFSKIEG